MSFPKDKIKAHIDYHIHLPISKKNCLDKRRMYLEKHKDKYKDAYEEINTPLEKLKMNQLIFPYYKKSVDADYIVKINKFVSTNDITDEQVWNIVWDVLINQYIKPWIDNFHKNNYADWKLKQQDKTSSELVKSSMNTSELIGDSLSSDEFISDETTDETTEETTEETEITDETIDETTDKTDITENIIAKDLSKNISDDVFISNDYTKNTTEDTEDIISKDLSKNISDDVRLIKQS